MPAIAETEIDGFAVTLERMSDDNDPARGEWVDCYVSQGRYSCSLAVLEDFGAIECDGRPDLKVHQATIDRIRAFADQHGYSD